ncbi:hypothetical protein [Microbacterium aurum]
MILAGSFGLAAVAALALLLLPPVTPAPALTPVATPTATSPMASPTATASAEAVPTGTVRTTLGEQRARLDMPTVPLVGLAVFFHGAGGDVDSRLDDAWLRSLVDAGWAVTSSDFHGNAWGAPSTSADLAALLEWTATQTDLSPTLLVADSMGALTSLNALARSTSFVPCWYGVEPVIDLRTVAGVSGSTAEIATAYGGTPTSADNPAENIDELASEGTSFRIISATADTLIPNADNAAALSDGLTAAGAEVGYRAIDADHGDPALFDADDLGAFAEGCLQ